MSEVKTLSTLLIKETYGSIKFSQMDWKKAFRYLLLVIGILVFAASTAVQFYALFVQGLVKEGIGMAFGMECLMTLFYIFYLFPSVFYFSQDLEVLLALPLKASSIILAKTLVVCIGILPFFLIFHIPLILLAGVLKVLSPLGLVLLFICGIALNLGVCMLMASVCLLVMGLLPKMRSKDSFMKWMNGLVTVFVLIYMFTTFRQGDIESSQGLNTYGNLGKFFFQIPYAVNAVFGNLSGFFITLLIPVAAGGLTYFLASKLYLKSAAAAISTSPAVIKTRRSKADDSSMELTFFKTEISRLYRAPVYLMNNLITVVIFPVLMIIMIIAFPAEVRTELNAGLSMLMDEMSSMGYSKFLIGAACGILIGLTFSTMNMISVTAISREGRDGVCWLKAIPLSAAKILNIKMGVGIFFSIISNICLLILFFLLGIYDPIFIAGYLIASCIGAVFSNQIGLIIDLVHPKLNWQEETAAVKQNMNCFLEMIVSLAIGTVFVCLMIFIDSPYVIWVLLILILLGIYLLRKIPARIFDKANF